jgi:hypothetical protein
MSDLTGSSSRDLARMAQSYATQALNEEEARAFEDILARDQTARDVLAQSVKDSQPDGPTARPDPAYRDRVRRRLRRSWWGRLTSTRPYAGHPLLWGTLGAAAALVAFLSLGRPQPRESPAEATATISQPEAPRVAAPEVPKEDLGEVARVWADLHNHEHLSRAIAEEKRRRTRAQDRRLTRGEVRRFQRKAPLTLE